MEPFNYALYERTSSQNGECYCTVKAIGLQKEMEVLEAFYKVKQINCSITPLKKFSLVDGLSKRILNESSLRGILAGDIPPPRGRPAKA